MGKSLILNVKRNVCKILIFLLVIIIYLPWFDLTKSLSSGDWPYLYKENILSFKIFPNNSFLWLEPYYNLTAKIGTQLLGFRWEITEKLFWFYPFLIISLFSSWIFVRLVLEKLNIVKFKELLILIGCLIFTTNTYVLMVVGGGQMGVGMAYALSPLVLYSYFRILENKNITVKHFLLFSLISSLQLMFEPRLFLITLLLVFMYFTAELFIEKKMDIAALKKLILANGLTVVLNLFWIIPNMNSFGKEYSQAANAANASFLSFATFPNTISLLHPNWPENIFGKIGFMKPEFIFIPILAYSSLLFLNLKNKKQRSIILFFVFVGLLGAFFAKGVNEPFGGLYAWLSGFPGGTLFRDPTKFYLWGVLAYSVLIPFATFSIYELIKSFSKKGKYLGFIFLTFVICYLLFLIRPVLLRELNGTFSPTGIPNEYIIFKNFLINDRKFSYVLWFPTRQRFGFYSQNHLSLNAQELIPTLSIQDLIHEFKKEKTEKIIKENEIRYVVVPYDSLREIFLSNREYDSSLYKKAIEELKTISWLRLVTEEDAHSKFGKIVIFEIID